jgi:alpha-1,2-mannosyltransferase
LDISLTGRPALSACPSEVDGAVTWHASRMVEPRVVPRWLLVPGALAFAVSVGSYLQVARVEGPQLSDPDIEVYVQAGSAFRHGLGVYDMAFTAGHWPFTYPPVTLLAFAPLSFLSATHAMVLMNALTVVALVGVALLSLRLAGLRGTPGLIGAALGVAAVALWLEPVQANLDDGQLNMLLALLVLADLNLPDRHRLKGVGVGVATAAKLVPGIFLVYLLVSRRPRAALTGTGVFALLTVVGFAAAPGDSWRYWFSGMFASSGRVTQDVSLGGALNQSLHTLAVRWTDSNVVYLGLAAVVLVLGLALARAAHAAGDELLGIVCAAFTGLLISPVSWTYHYVWVVPLLIAATALALRAPETRRTWLLAVPAALFLVFLAWPGRGRAAGVAAPRGVLWHVPAVDDPSTWHGITRVLGDAYTLTGLAVLILAGLWLRRPLRTLDIGHAVQHAPTPDARTIAGRFPPP